ncbi:hypothetical protein ACVWW1_002366 [Bradyrhizobium sp. JR3.5]
MPLLVVKPGQYNLANFSWFAFCRRYHFHGFVGRIARSLSCPTAQASFANIIRFIRNTTRCMVHPSHPIEGRFAVVTNAGSRCGGRGLRSRRMRVMRTVKSCGPDALAAGVFSQDADASCEGSDKQAQSRRGEHEISRNPSRRESRIAPVTPVVLPPSFLPFARGPWVRSAPGFPCALCSREGGNTIRNSGELRREIATTHLFSQVRVRFP